MSRSSSSSLTHLEFPCYFRANDYRGLANAASFPPRISLNSLTLFYFFFPSAPTSYEVPEVLEPSPAREVAHHTNPASSFSDPVDIPTIAQGTRVDDSKKGIDGVETVVRRGSQPHVSFYTQFCIDLKHHDMPGSLLCPRQFSHFPQPTFPARAAGVPVRVVFFFLRPTPTEFSVMDITEISIPTKRETRNSDNCLVARLPSLSDVV